MASGGRLPKLRRYRTKATQGHVRGRKLDEGIESAPPRLVNRAVEGAQPAETMAQHPSAARFSGRLRRHLRRAVGPKGRRTRNR